VSTSSSSCRSFVHWRSIVGVVSGGDHPVLSSSSVSSVVVVVMILIIVIILIMVMIIATNPHHLCPSSTDSEARQSNALRKGATGTR
jgi:hypothetical protein